MCWKWIENFVLVIFFGILIIRVFHVSNSRRFELKPFVIAYGRFGPKPSRIAYGRFGKKPSAIANGFTETVRKLEYRSIILDGFKPPRKNRQDLFSRRFFFFRFMEGFKFFFFFFVVVARAALYLVSDETNYVSGLNILVDGGYSVMNPSMMRFISSFN
jgi:hypothetical protein